jgi:DNA-binding GntR family transcriptional regulator
MSSHILAGVNPLGTERTVEQAVIRDLRELIAGGTLEPGIRLRYRELAAQFGVSVTPVRIALRDLAQEGLVELTPHGGARVTPLSIEELEELYAARAGLEGLLAYLGTERLDDEGLALTRSRLTELVRRAKRDDRRGYLEMLWAYRLPCYTSAERPRLLERVSLLRRRAARYNQLTLADTGRFAGSLAFQKRFYDACAARDRDAAEVVVREAMDWSRRYLVAKYADGWSR